MKKLRSYNSRRPIDTDDCEFNCELLIEDTAAMISKELNIPAESLTKYFTDLIDNVKYEISNIEGETVELDDFELDEIEDHLLDCGYFVLKCTSINEQYKVEAFLQKLKNDPYGPMFIL